MWKRGSEPSSPAADAGGLARALRRGEASLVLLDSRNVSRTPSAERGSDLTDSIAALGGARDRQPSIQAVESR